MAELDHTVNIYQELPSESRYTRDSNNLCSDCHISKVKEMVPVESVDGQPALKVDRGCPKCMRGQGYYDPIRIQKFEQRV